MQNAVRQVQAAIGRQNEELRQQAQQNQHAGGPEIIGRLGEVVERLNPPEQAAQRVPQLIQAKDIGKPPIFKNEEGRFSEWLQKLNSHVLSVFVVGFKAVIEWAVDRVNNSVVLTTAIAVFQFVDEAIDGEEVDAIDEKLSQFYALFISLTEGESFDLAVKQVKGTARRFYACRRVGGIRRAAVAAECC
eukprot:3200670-Pyramimonas_sp.AAC.1